MKCFNYFRAKDPVLAAIISMGMIMSAQAIASAQYNDWEEVGSDAQSAQQQLMSAPPQIAANVSGQVNYRPPVAVPNVAKAKTDGTAIQNEYVVQAGDTLPKIAMKVYGDPNRWQDLMVLNNIDNGNRIFVGQKLITVAGANIVAEDSPLVAENEVAEMPEDSESADASYYSNAVSSNGTYTVKRGDTLGKIAKVCLGSTSKWQKIAKANPNINPNRLKVGDVLVIPGAAKETSSAPVYNNYAASPAPSYEMDQVSNRNVSAQPWQMAAATNVADNGYANYNNGMYNQVEAPTVSAPSFDPNTAPLVAPPPPPPGMYDNYSSGSSFSAPPAPAPKAKAKPAYSAPVVAAAPVSEPAPTQVYSSGTMAPPAMPNTAPDVPYIVPSASNPNVSVSADSVGVSTHNLYREDRYRLPDELKPIDFDPYFTNINGYRGLFNVESALVPYLPTWNVGFSFKYEDLKYLGGDKNIIDGYRTYSNLHLNYTGHKFFAGVTVPFQTWEEKLVAGGATSKLDGMHDPSVKVGYQVWKNFEGTHSVTFHLEGKFAGGNYHSAILGTGLKTKINSRIGPAGATNGSWVEAGGAYSGVLDDKWTTHLNVAVANDSTDDITKFILRGGADYRVNRNFSLVGEVEFDSYEAPTNIFGPDGTNAELTLGMVFFNDSWQANIGFPMTVKQDWGTQSSFGVIASLNHRWD